MIFNWFFSIFSLQIFILIQTNKEFQFGILNHRTQWHFHCPQNHTKIVNPPTNEQPLIPYECPIPSPPIQILPLEIDLTFLCRSQSRFIWLIIDLYQYNTYFWLLDPQDLQISIQLNRQIHVQQSKIETKNFTNRFIIINAFYIPFESIDSILDEQIHVTIQLQNLDQYNSCQFEIVDNDLWKVFLQQKCDFEESKTFFIQSAQCDFYSKEHPTTTSTTNQNILLSTEPMFEQNQTKYPILYDHRHHFLLSEEKYLKLLTSITHSKFSSMLLKLIFLFLLITLVILILFFLYMFCYHYHHRTRSSLLIPTSSMAI